MLHLIKNSPFSDNSLALCLDYLGENSAILLIENAVYAAVDKQIWIEKLIRSKAAIYALKEDVEARSLTNNISDGIALIDINGFVELTEQYATITSW